MSGSKILVAGLLLVGVCACHKPGPAERAGQQVDAAVSNLRDSAQEAAKKADEAAEKLRERVKQARDEQ